MFLEELAILSSCVSFTISPKFFSCLLRCRRPNRFTEKQYYQGVDEDDWFFHYHDNLKKEENDYDTI